MAAAALLNGLEEKWAQATVGHEFIRACISGSIKREQFDRWLVQDYLYVRGFTAFAGAVLASAPDKHQEVLISGIAALTDELSWFQKKASERGMQSACQAYRAYLKQLQSAPYVIQAVAFWAIELCYNQAWGAVLQQGQGTELKEFAHRWGNPEFGEYVQQLQHQADEALEQSPDYTKAAKETVERVAELECGFWSMAFSAE
eukprot:gene2683-2984_t